MENTVMPGDLVIVDPTTQVRRGDVIVEQEPSVGPSYYIRRVIGLPGDHVECCDARGRITVNGKALDETYLYPGDAPSKFRFNVTVPAGELWLMGDHRSVAYDAQYTGPLAVRVVGRVIFVFRSHDSLIFLRTPQTFVTDGLAPADTRYPAALILLGVNGLTWLLLVALVVFGVIRFAIRIGRRRRARGAPAAVVSS
jgi:signal peptidase I